MALWVWKAKVGVMVGLLLLWESPPFLFFLPCDCMELDHAQPIVAEPKLQGYIKNTTRFNSFFQHIIEEVELLNEGKYSERRFDAASAFGSTRVLDLKTEEADICIVHVGSQWHEVVPTNVYTRRNKKRSSSISHRVKPNTEWVYRVPNTAATHSCKTAMLHFHQRNRVPRHKDLVSFYLTKAIFGGTVEKNRLKGKLEGKFMLTKVLLSEDPQALTSTDPRGVEEHGEGDFLMVYGLNRNEKLARKVLVHGRWTNIIPDHVPKGSQNTAYVKARVFDVWEYNDQDPHKDPKRIVEGVPTILRWVKPKPTKKASLKRVPIRPPRMKSKSSRKSSPKVVAASPPSKKTESSEKNSLSYILHEQGRSSKSSSFVVNEERQPHSKHH